MIVWEFPGLVVGQRVRVFEQLASTNDAALQIPIGEAVVALHQTAGRGQYGRVWASQPGVSLLLSVAVAPRVRRPVLVTAWAAVAVADAVQVLTGHRARLKWPNDLLVENRKIAGILIEQTDRVVVGLGLNLNQTAADFDAHGLPGAASLAMLTGRAVDGRAAAGAVLTALSGWYPAVNGTSCVELERAWVERIALVGTQVVVELADGTEVAGRLHGLAFAGVEVGGETILPERVRQIRAQDQAPMKAG